MQTGEQEGQEFVLMGVNKPRMSASPPYAVKQGITASPCPSWIKGVMRKSPWKGLTKYPDTAVQIELQIPDAA